MASFSEDNFSKKLVDLNNSQQSIQTLSLWLIHHRKHSKVIVKVWMKETKKVKPQKKLTMLYLANDVIQNSKKKGPEFNRDFKTALPHAFSHTAKEVDEKIKGSMERLCNIWKERGVFEADFVEILKGNLRKGEKKVSSDSSSGQENKTPEPEDDLEKKEKEKREKEKREKEKREKEKREKMKQEKEKREKEKREKEKKQKEREKRERDKKNEDTSSQPPKKKKKSELTLKEEIELEFANGPCDPPEPEKLVKSLRDLETSASSDAAVRERIAALPPEVSDVSLLSKVTDGTEAGALLSSVEAACGLLTDYNSRLGAELAERRHVARMLRDFIAAQKAAIQDAEEKLQEYKERLKQVETIQKELKSHIQSLPDMSLLPAVTGGLAPLPSAGDLFNIDQALGID